VKDQEHTQSARDRKKANRGEHEQLRFAFFTEEAEASTDADQLSSQDDVSDEISDCAAERQASPGVGLARAVTAARGALLDVPLREVDAQLPLLLEFCEAALTRALDVAHKRPQTAFSDEEYRSLRGIGQAHWLLVERQSREK
jgi:hypothetical protein